MDCSHYEALRPFGCFMYLEIGFTSFLSNLIGSIQERKALRSANRARLVESQDVIDAIFARIELLPLLDRTDVLAGPELALALAVMSASVATVVSECPRVCRPVVIPRPIVHVCRPNLASESAYLALTLCVFPLHRGHLESYEMDQGVRLVEAGLLVEEYDDFIACVEWWYGGDTPNHTTEIPNITMNLCRNLKNSILGRLRHLSIAFLPVGSRGEPFRDVLDRIRMLCQTGNACYQTARDDPRRALYS